VSPAQPGRRSPARVRRDALRSLLASPTRAATGMLALEVLGTPVALRERAGVSAPWSTWVG